MRLNRKIKALLFTVCGIALILVGFWVYTGVHLGLWKYSEYERYYWLTKSMPIARALWHGEVKAGDDLEHVVAKWRPDSVRRFGPWVDLKWYPGGINTNYLSLIGIAVVAKDGVIVRADSYSDDLLCARTFFNTLSPQAEAEHRAAFVAYVDGLRNSRTNTTTIP
jgi:hypothetical protein